MAPAIACSIPVFRYALENWRPDPYTAYVLHRGNLTDDQQSHIDTLQAKAFAGTTSVNLVVKTIDLDVEPPEQLRGLDQDISEDMLPRLVVRSPGRGRLAETVLTGELNSQNVSQLLASPLRKEVSDRLLKGHSVVWVYLECGRADEDDKAFEMLQEQLVRLQDEIDLPEIEEEDLKDLSADPDALKIQFSAIRLARNNVEESAFRDMLLHVESDLRDEPYADQPMAFPIFGRGRALYALVGDGLAPDLIEEACRFLTGACQCTVKAENPGVDILMQVEWDRFIKPTEAVDAALPPLAGFSGFGAQATDAATNDDSPVDLSTADEETSVAEDSSPVVADTEEPEPTSAAAPDLGLDSAPSTDSVASNSDATATVWKNTMYVLLSAGCVVTLATLFLLRRSAG